MPPINVLHGASMRVLQRVGSTRPPGPLGWPSLEFVRSNGGGRHRFDDPLGSDSEYTVLYAAEERRDCFAETLDQYRVTFDEIAALVDRLPPDQQLDEEEFESLLARPIPEVYFERKRLASFAILGMPPFLDVRLSATDTADALSVDPHLAPVLGALGLRRLTPSDLVSGDRRLTQAVSRWSYEREFGGIAFNGSHTPHDSECWALFSGRTEILSVGSAASIDRHDPDLLAVARRFNLIVPESPPLLDSA